MLDGTSENLFWIVDVNNYPTLSPYYATKFSYTHDSIRITAGTSVFSTHKATLTPFNKLEFVRQLKREDTSILEHTLVHRWTSPNYHRLLYILRLLWFLYSLVLQLVSQASRIFSVRGAPLPFSSAYGTNTAGSQDCPAGAWNYFTMKSWWY